MNRLIEFGRMVEVEIMGQFMNDDGVDDFG